MADHHLHSTVRAGIPRARARFLTQSMQLEEHEMPGVISIGVLLTTLLIIGAIVWAYVTPVTEVAQTEGEIIPAGHIHQVQHLEGGIVKKIHINNGDQVKKGDILIELSTNTIASEHAQINTRKQSLKAKLWRINALLSDDQSLMLAGKTQVSLLQKQLYEEQMNNFNEQISLIEAQKRQRTQEVISKRKQTKALEKEVAIIEERQTIHKSVEHLEVIPKVDILDADARLARAVSQLRDVESEIQIAQEGIRESEQKKVEFISRWRQDLRLEAEQISNDIAEVEEEYSRVSERLARLEIISPVTGVVQALQVNTLNAVIEPGAVILELVPVDDELVAETHVLPKDIGHVQAGQRVDVKISSFESQRFGSIKGSLRYVSATTYLDQEHQPYYKAEIILAQNFVGEDPSINKLVPGMIVDANIHTGEKTILDYILKPVYRGFNSALHER